MGLKISQIDAFTERPFGGNPAAVCLLPEPRDEAWMQAVAAEMNLSETAFLTRRSDGFDLRWFTPEAEVDLCGHATLASAHYLWESGELQPGRVARFHSRGGPLTAKQRDGGIELDFPATASEPAAAPADMLEALGTAALSLRRTKFDYLVEVASEEAVRSLKPDFAALRRVDTRGVMVTASGDSRYDFVSRFFAPKVGIDEDPVTGSAHCALAPFWAARLAKKEMRAYQASRRGGEVGVRIEADRVILVGRAVTVMHGELVDSSA